MHKKLLFLPLIGVVLLTSGCDSEVEDLQPLTLQEVAGNRLAALSQDEKDSLVYNYVSDRILVDTKNLLKVPSSDLDSIKKVFTSANKTLKSGKEDKLSKEYANYLLMNFARTPYEWEQTEINPVGYDASSRLYFVDVTYKTTSTMKSVIPSSKIPYGDEDAEKYKQMRYDEYTSYLDGKISGNPEANSEKREFEKRWGKIDDIKEQQQGVSILERTSKKRGSSSNLGRLTYTGLLADSNFNTGATMTVRYVLKYNYNLGEETDMGISSLYIKDYTIDGSDDIVKMYENQTSEADKNGTEVLKPFIDKLLTSYFKAVEESNHSGLNKLFYSYGQIDKYFDDLNSYAYTQTDGYKYQVLSRNGTNVTVKVTTEAHERAKGSGMSMPTYDQSYIFNLILDSDDNIKIDNVSLLSSKLVGEPISEIQNVSGVSDLIQYSKDSFTDSNKKDVKEVIKKFSKTVFAGKVDDSNFTSNVDIGVSDSTLNKMTSTITSLKNNKKKTTFIQSWDTTNNTYASLTLREIFETSDQGNLDTEAVIDLINRDGEWKVVNYTRTLNVKTSATTVDSKDALTVDE